jgi:hypothetical protein
MLDGAPAVPLRVLYSEYHEHGASARTTVLLPANAG